MTKLVAQPEALDALAVGFSDINANIIGDPEFAAIWEAGLAAPDTLGTTEKIRFSMHMQCYINHCTALKKYHDLSVLPDDQWSEYLCAFCSLMRSPGRKWLSDKMAIPPGLRAEIQDFSGEVPAYAWGTGNEASPDQALKADA